MVKDLDEVEAVHLRIAEIVQQLYSRPDTDSETVIAEREERTIYVADLETDGRFPLYSRDALEQTPIRSIMAFQMFIAGETMGALNVYAEQPNAFGPASRDIGLVFAAHSSVAWNAARRDEQFKRALASRDVIGQAKGMIMERYGVDAVQAFEVLRKLSQDSNVALVQVAADLVGKAQSET